VFHDRRFLVGSCLLFEGEPTEGTHTFD
jgi:hypothetical protein